MRPFKDYEQLRIFRVIADDDPLPQPQPVWREVLTALALGLIVLSILGLSGCSVQPSTAVQAKRDGVTQLAETAVRPIRPQPLDVDESPYLHAPSLPNSAAAWTEPAASLVSDDYGTPFEPYQPPIAPQAQNVSPCGPNGCSTSPPRFFRRRWR